MGISNSERKQIEREALAQMRVIKREKAAENVWMFELEPLSGAGISAFTAGAHLALHLLDGVRQYSLCNGPDEKHVYRIAVRREENGRGISRYLCDALQEGDEVAVSGPFNHFPLAGDAEQSLLIAAGIGITPMLAMALELEAQGRPFEMHYAGRTCASMAFLPQIRQRFQHVAHVYAADIGNGARMALDQVIPLPRPGHHLYVCGPGVFIEQVCSDARAKGWPDSQVHFEHFQAEQPAAQAGDGAFEVLIQSSGQRITVNPDETVADALQRSGVYLNLSCGSGVCGSCRTGVLAGEVDHRDYFFSAQEQASNSEFTPCCSRAHSAHLVLDL